MAENAKLAAAVEALHQAFLEVRRLSGDASEAVLHAPSATTYLFPDSQAELRRMERAERRQAAERAAILDALPAHLAILDQSGTIVAVNAAWRAFAHSQNYPDDSAAIGLNYLEVCNAVSGNDETVAKWVARGLERVLAGSAGEISIDYPCQTPDALLWFNVRIAPLVGTDRPGAIVMHVNTTEEHAAKRREAELQGRVERLIDQAGIGILVHRDHRPVFTNPALVAMLGLSRREDILGVADVRHLFHPSHDGDVGLGDATVQLQPKVFPDRLTGHRHDGTPVTFETRIFPITWGERPAVCAMFTDITEYLRIEEKLRAAQKLEAIGQLTGGIAHDFNNLLTVILGAGELLQEALQDEPGLARLAEQSILMAERGAELTKRLLAFARRQPLNPQRTDVNDRLLTVEDLMRRTLGADVDIALALSRQLWPAMVDPGEFDNAILNLSINSRDAMPKGGHLKITTENIELDQNSPETGPDLPPGAYVVVTVADDGTGMTKATLARIYEPFFTTKDVNKGSGLGLSMVYGFVKQTGGHIMIQSEIGRGTSVRLFLPRGT